MRWEERRKASVERQYGMRISVDKALMSLGKKASDSIYKEIVGLHNIKCWRPIRYKSLSTKQKKKMIRSFMFLKEKYNSEGDFDKLKSRLVAGGASTQRQRRHLPQYLFLRCTLWLRLSQRRIVRLGLQT